MAGDEVFDFGVGELMGFVVVGQEVAEFRVNPPEINGMNAFYQGGNWTHQPPCPLISPLSGGKLDTSTPLPPLSGG